MRLCNPKRAEEHPARESANESATELHSLRTPLSLHHTLRAATAEPHARLHLHAGFAAIQNGTIDLVDYRSLLVRLYGFHVSFEAAVDIESDRSAWLRDDLTALAMSVPTLTTLPRCTALTAFDKPLRRLGALYVVEGAMLGGRQLARQLDPLLGGAGSAGRRFFLGRGADTHAAWSAFVARLKVAAATPGDVAEVVAAAVATFGLFEEWLRGWRSFT